MLSTPPAMSPQNGTDWEQDALMQHLLKRKRRLEELEEYNMPEAMLKKRRAVKEVAQRTPSLTISTEYAHHGPMSEWEKR